MSRVHRCKFSLKVAEKSSRTGTRAGNLEDAEGLRVERLGV